MILELDDADAKIVLELLAKAKAEPRKGEVIKGVKGVVEVVTPTLCPEMCFRFQEYGKCVHLEKEPVIKPSYTAEYERRKLEKVALKVQTHKANEKPDTKWECVADWKKLPFTYGVYIWVDEKDRLIYIAKGADMRRRHFTWSNLKDPRFMQMKKIWWLHTGWYNELLEAFRLIKYGSVITKELLEEVLLIVRPIEALLPEPPSS